MINLLEDKIMNYKTLFLFLLFVNCVWLGFGLEHDSYQVCLGVVAGILACVAAYSFFKNRFVILVACAFFAVFFCQLSAVTREAVRSSEFRQNFNRENTTGHLVGDNIHGFKRIWNIFKNEIPEGIVEAKSSDKYTTWEDMRYRYLGAVLGFLICLSFILKRRPKKLRRKS